MLVKLIAKFCALFVYIGFVVFVFRFFSSFYDRLLLKLKEKRRNKK